jgi:hypothetical protein
MEAADQRIDETIWLLHCEGLPNRRIAGLTLTGRHRIADVIPARLIGEFRYHKKGRSVKGTDDVRQSVVTIGQMTIRNLLHGAQFFWRPQKKCPNLTEAQMRAQQQFVLDWNEPLFNEARNKNLIFTDEFRFCRKPDGHWVWRRRGVYRMHIMDPTDKYPPVSILVWGRLVSATSPSFKSSWEASQGKHI